MVVLVPRGWEESHGTAAEIARAQERAIPVFLPFALSDSVLVVGSAHMLGDDLRYKHLRLESWLRGRAAQ